MGAASTNTWPREDDPAFRNISPDPDTGLIHELLAVHFEVIPPGPFRFESHLHHFHQLDVVLSGWMDIDCEDHPLFKGKRGDAILLPPLARHSYRSDKGFEHASFKFMLSARHWAMFGRQPRSMRIGPVLLKALRAAGDASLSQQPLARHQVTAVAALCLVEAVRQSSRSLGRHDDLDEFRQSLWPILEEVSNENGAGWTVAAMSDRLCLSLDHFSRCFHQTIGLPPRDYLRNLRIRHAAVQLLADPFRPIKQIAEEAGYATVHPFTRSFKEIMGVNPAAYRQGRMRR
jgi:AraC-like DNA-binding protein